MSASLGTTRAVHTSISEPTIAPAPIALIIVPNRLASPPRTFSENDGSTMGTDQPNMPAATTSSKTPPI